MTTFSENATYGELYGPTASITTEAEAEAYMQDLIAYHSKRWNLHPEESEHILAQNIGYFAGYFDMETAKRVWKLFKTTHPVFG